MVGLTREQRAQRMSESAVMQDTYAAVGTHASQAGVAGGTAGDSSGSALRDDRPARSARKPFGSQMQKLAYAVRPNYHRHWFNDTPGRIQQALEAGYSHVKDTTGDHVTRIVDAGGLKAYLMETPQEWYDEDMRAEQGRVDEVDKAIRRGAIEGEPEKDGRYVPQRGIKMERR